ncbi:formyltransferase family protein [Spirulina subsalsa]|uniref:formyltransferase family protein n=1 Tax=Spirulina subsalsa TaxID=54311 RepID=UPI00031E4792|nr:formyltransferase family protein [Spirulina subsalsa]
MSKPTVILLGSKPGAIVALQLMLQSNWEVKAVVPSGSHSFITGDTLKDFAQKQKLSVLTQDELESEKVDLVISYMFRDKVTKTTLSLAKKAAVNFHAGPLPEYGGWAFYNLAILESASEYGCTCHHMDEGFDTGPLLKVNRFQIDPEKETAVSLEQKSQEEMILLFKEFMTMVEDCKELPKINQDPSRMRYLKKKDFEKLKRIPVDADQHTIQRIARAFFYPPYECAYIDFENTRVEVIPEIVKWELAKQLHKEDLISLRKVAGIIA